MTLTAEPQIRVLLVEDEPADARLVSREIQRAGGRAFTITHVTTLAEAAVEIGDGVDVVLLDLSLPDSFGLATLDAIAPLLPPVCPVLILTGNDDHRAALAAVEAGAQDYLVKGQADGSQLCRAIQHAIRRKQLEERLRLSEERFKAIFTLAHDPILAADRDMKLVMFNRAAEETFRLPAQAAMGQPMDALFTERCREDFCERFAGLLDGGEPDPQRCGVGFSIWAQRADGSPFIAEASLSRIAVPDGFIVAATVRDVSEQRAAQMSLQHQAAEMQALAQRLDAALVVAEQASKTKSEFLAMMSHEIRTPLNGILGMTRLLLDQSMPPPQREKMEIIHDSGEALLAILNDILDFSKLEAGRVELEAADFDVVRVVRSTVALMESRAHQKGVDLAVVISPRAARVVNGDPNRLRQILLNLVGNAVKFTAVGFVRVLVEQERGDACETCLRFTVEDTGIGIDEEAQSRLFQDFAQADASVARRFGGTGLGLAICKRLVELMGGEIGVDSQPGAGSRFWFVTPFRPAVDDSAAAPCGPARAPAWSAAARPEPAAAPAAPMELLLAEDNPVNQMVVRGFLESRNHRVTVVENGFQAVEAVRTTCFDAVLMDMQMPVMDGLEATRFIRSLPAPQGEIPVIALTANAMAGDDERCIAAGMNDYVRKPVAPEELFGALARAIAHGRRPAAPPPVRVEDTPVLEREVFDALAEAMGDDVLPRLLQQYVSDVRPRVERCARACECGDLAAAQQDAHDTKSMSATFGLMALARTAELIECACRDADAATARHYGRMLQRRLDDGLSAVGLG